MNSTRMKDRSSSLKWTAAAFAAASTVLCLAEPSVTVLSLTQDASSRRMTVEYRLDGGPAIVTAEVLTNGIPVRQSSTTSNRGASATSADLGCGARCLSGLSWKSRGGAGNEEDAFRRGFGGRMGA